MGLLHTSAREPAVDPSGKAILGVEGALAVTNDDESVPIIHWSLYGIEGRHLDERLPYERREFPSKRMHAVQFLLDLHLGQVLLFGRHGDSTLG